METEVAIRALKMALRRLDGKPAEDLIHHSDRGVQYASYAYTDIQKEHHIIISKTECGYPKDKSDPYEEP